jgi:hypothetical protein
MARYLQNIVVFLRLNRAVAGGISAKATKHFLHLAMLVLKIIYAVKELTYQSGASPLCMASTILRHRSLHWQQRKFTVTELF